MTRRFPLSALALKLLPTLLLLFAVASAQADTVWTLPEDTDIFAGVSTIEDGFLVTVGWQYVRYDPGCEEPVLTVPVEGRWVTRSIYADGQGTFWSVASEYDAASTTLRQLVISDGKASILQRFTLPVYINMSARPVLLEDAIFLYDQLDKSFYRFDFRTGETTLHPQSAYLECVQPYRDGLFIAHYYDRTHLQRTVVSVDPLTGVMTPLLILDHYPQAMAYCPETDQLAYVVSPNVYACTLGTGEEPTRQGYLPLQPADGSLPEPSMALNSAGVCAVLEGHALTCVTLDPDWGRQGRMLSIASILDDSEITKRFRRGHPEIPVDSVPYWFHLTPGKIAELLRTGDTTHDIFMQYSHLSGFDKLLDRGFAADLSSSAVLTAWAEDLTPVVRQAVTRDGRLMAVPVGIDFTSNNTLAYDEALLADFGIDPADLPGDLPSLLTRLTQWYEDGTLADVRVLEQSKSQAERLYNLVFFCYTNYATSDDGWPDYQSPLFLDLMTKCEALIAAMERQQCQREGLPALFQETTLEEWVSGELAKRGLTFFPLAMEEGAAPQYFANVTVALLSPIALRREQAMTYLEAVSQDLDPLVKLYLCPDVAQVEVFSDYEERKADYLWQIERLQTDLEETDENVLSPDLRQQYEETLDHYQYWLRDLEENGHWRVSPAMLENARAIQGQIVMERELINGIYEGNELGRLFSGQCTLQQYVQDMIRREQMAKMEEM